MQVWLQKRVLCINRSDEPLQSCCNCHDEWKELTIEATAACRPIDDHFKSYITLKAIKIYSWICIVVFGDKEIQKFSKIESTTTKKTLTKYLEALQRKVE